MATWDDVHRIATALPAVLEREGGHDGMREWRVKDKNFVWERPLRKADLSALGEAAPAGPILGIRVADLDTKEAVLAEHPESAFTTPHFDGYPAVLIDLPRITADDLHELISEAWTCRAPKKIVRQYLEKE